jgi:predicted dinucleotide-binding enzyme
MSIAIIGMGRFGRAFGKALNQHDINVQFGVSDLMKYKDSLLEFGKKASLTTVSDAIAAAEIVVLAVPYHAACQIAASIPDWNNRILIDVTTPLLPDVSGLEIGYTTSGAEQIASKAHNAIVIKAFNTIGAETIEKSSDIKKNVFLPICGDDISAKNKVMALANKIGFNAVDTGALNTARFIEPIAMMWIQLAVNQGWGKSFEFGLLKK